MGVRILGNGTANPGTVCNANPGTVGNADPGTFVMQTLALYLWRQFRGRSYEQQGPGTEVLFKA